MGTWTDFYINTNSTEAVVEKLAALTDNLDITPNTPFPSEIGQYYMMDSRSPPTYLAVGKIQSDWATVVHNSFGKLEDWGIELSKHFSCKVIVTMAQSVSMAYYFALYNNGKKLREIEVCYDADFDMVNFGDKFPFENPEPGKRTELDGEVSYVFDFDAIEEYCKHFNLTIQTDYDTVQWTVLKGKNIRKEVAEYIQKYLVKKPWWKFW